MHRRVGRLRTSRQAGKVSRRIEVRSPQPSGRPDSGTLALQSVIVYDFAPTLARYLKMKISIVKKHNARLRVRILSPVVVYI